MCKSRPLGTNHLQRLHFDAFKIGSLFTALNFGLIPLKVKLFFADLYHITFSLPIQLDHDFRFLPERFKLGLLWLLLFNSKSIFSLNLSKNSLVHAESFVLKCRFLNVYANKLVILENVVVKV